MPCLPRKKLPMYKPPNLESQGPPSPPIGQESYQGDLVAPMGCELAVHNIMPSEDMSMSDVMDHYIVSTKPTLSLPQSTPLSNLVIHHPSALSSCLPTSRLWTPSQGQTCLNHGWHTFRSTIHSGKLIGHVHHLTGTSTYGYCWKELREMSTELLLTWQGKSSRRWAFDQSEVSQWSPQVW